MACGPHICIILIFPFYFIVKENKYSATDIRKFKECNWKKLMATKKDSVDCMRPADRVLETTALNDTADSRSSYTQHGKVCKASAQRTLQPAIACRSKPRLPAFINPSCYLGSASHNRSSSVLSDLSLPTVPLLRSHTADLQQRDLKISVERIVPQLHILRDPGSNLGPDSGYSYWDFQWFSSLSPYICSSGALTTCIQNILLKISMTAYSAV